MTSSSNAGAKTLVVVRHGNTFRSGETPTRVGARTDLPLVEEERAKKAALFLRERGLRPERVFAPTLRRTTETARIIARELGLPDAVVPADGFAEIDYGPDENKTEEEVCLRIGRECLAGETGIADPPTAAAMERGERAIREWDENGTPPKGWLVDVDAIKRRWREFADGIGAGETVLLVSSNGVIRFAPCLLIEGYDAFRARERIKVSTGGVCVFEDRGDGWECLAWNSRGVSPR